MKKDLRLLLVAAFVLPLLAVPGCRSVGERTAILAKYGTGYWVEHKGSHGTSERHQIVGGKIFARQVLKNGELIRQEHIRRDGSLHALHEYRNGQRHSRKLFYHNGQLQSFTVYSGDATDEMILYETYHEDGRPYHTWRKGTGTVIHGKSSLSHT